jgi:hypothetical protein
MKITSSTGTFGPPYIINRTLIKLLMNIDNKHQCIRKDLIIPVCGSAHSHDHLSGPEYRFAKYQEHTKTTISFHLLFVKFCFVYYFLIY